MKPVNFGLVYGMGANTLWQEFLKLGNNLLFAEAQHLYDTWHNTFPEIHTYQNKCKANFYASSAELPLLGATPHITSMRGRLRRPETLLKTTTPFTKLDFKKTQIVNFPIQSTCSDFLKAAVRLIYAEIVNQNLNAQIVLTAHDEIVLECTEDARQAVSARVSDIMISVAQKILAPRYNNATNAPIDVDAGFGLSWADKP